MKSTFYYRKNELGFSDWCSSILKCKSIKKSYLLMTRVEQKNYNAKYLKVKRVLREYAILKSSLNEIQRDILENYLILGKTIQDKNKQKQVPIIYENWLEIVFSSKDAVLKEYSMKEIGDFITNARTKAEYSREQAAGVLGISSRTLSRYENGYSYPKIEVFLKMLELYDINM